MKTLTNIKAGVILTALRQAKPVTAVGRAAVENYRAYLIANPMTAIALENSIISLTTSQRDAGLEGLVATLKGIMPASKRRVAVAYELLANEQKTFFSASEACLEALSNLYELNATKIIDAINGGALDAFKTNPTINKLIAWSKSAAKAEPERVQQVVGDIKMSLTPILNIASAGDENMIVAIDGKAYLLGKRGKLTYIPALGDYDAVTGDVAALVACLSQLHASETEPNVLMLNDDILEFVKKALPINSFGIDLLAGIGELVRMNDEAMSTDKATAMLKQNADDIIANMLLSDGAKDALSIVGSIMSLFEKYRGTIWRNAMATKFSYGDGNHVYIVTDDDRMTVVNVVGGNVLDSTVYSSAFEMLASEVFVANPDLHAIVSKAFAKDLKEDVKKMSVRQQLAQKLADERKQYEALLDRINAEIDELATVEDANPEKAVALSEIKKKTEEAIAKVADEIDSLTRTKA